MPRFAGESFSWKLRGKSRNKYCLDNGCSDDYSCGMKTSGAESKNTDSKNNDAISSDVSGVGESRNRKFDSLEQEVYLSIWRTYDRLRALEDGLFAGLDLTPQQYNVLRILQVVAPRPLPTLKISERLISRAPDITRMIDKLEQRGLVTRLRSQEDRRTVFVAITEAGLQLLTELQGSVERMHREQAGHLSQSDSVELCRLLRKLRKPHEGSGSSW